jgi:hypothetical protein
VNIIFEKLFLRPLLNVRFHFNKIIKNFIKYPTLKIQI